MDDELPPSVDDPGAMDDYWHEETTITLPRHIKRSLGAHRDDQPWGRFLEQLRREHADPLTFTSVEAIADELNQQLESRVTFDGKYEMEPVDKPEYDDEDAAALDAALLAAHQRAEAVGNGFLAELLWLELNSYRLDSAPAE